MTPNSDEKQLEADRDALLAEEQSIMKEHEALRLTPNDRPGHAAHHARLNVYRRRLEEYHVALRRKHSGQ